MDRADDLAGSPVFLADIVRGQIVFRTIYALFAAVRAMYYYEPIVITRVKDRFAKQASGGWVRGKLLWNSARTHAIDQLHCSTDVVDVCSFTRPTFLSTFITKLILPSTAAKFSLF